MNKIYYLAFCLLFSFNIPLSFSNDHHLKKIDKIFNFKYAGQHFTTNLDSKLCILGHSSLTQGPIDLTNNIKLKLVQKNEKTPARIIISIKGQDPYTLNMPNNSTAKKYLKKIQDLHQQCQTEVVDTEQETPPQEMMEDYRPFGVYDMHEFNRSTEPESFKAILLKPEETFQLRHSLSLKAKKRIYIQALTFMADNVGIHFANILVRKKMEGVDVEVSIDALATDLNPFEGLTAWRNTTLMLNNLMAAGIKVNGFDCRGGAFFRGQFKKYFKTKNIKAISGRNHEKIFLSDDAAIIGGTNLSNIYYGINPQGPGHWNDHDLYFTNKELITDLENVIEAHKKFYKDNYPHAGSSCYNPHPVGSQDYIDFYFKHYKNYPKAVINHAPESRENLNRLITNSLRDFSFSKVIEKEKLITRAQLLHSRPKIGETSIADSYVSLINKAQNEIFIMNAYVLPFESVKKALISAIKRGVKVHMITNKMYLGDFNPVPYQGSRFYRDILDAGANNSLETKPHVYEWAGVNTKGQVRWGITHTKLMLVDNEYLLIGSFNLDNSSLNYNSEIAVLVQSEELGSQLHDLLKNEYIPLCYETSYAKAMVYQRPRGLSSGFTHIKFYLLNRLEWYL